MKLFLSPVLRMSHQSYRALDREILMNDIEKTFIDRRPTSAQALTLFDGEPFVERLGSST